MKPFAIYAYDRIRLMTALAKEVGLPEACYGVTPYSGERMRIRYGDNCFEGFPQYGQNREGNPEKSRDEQREDNPASRSLPDPRANGDEIDRGLEDIREHQCRRKRPDDRPELVEERRQNIAHRNREAADCAYRDAHNRPRYNFLLENV